MTKLQIPLTDEETNLLTQKAAELGYDVTKYAKFLLAREAEDVLRGTPTYIASPSLDKMIAQAIEDDEHGKSKEWPSGKYDN